MTTVYGLRKLICAMLLLCALCCVFSSCFNSGEGDTQTTSPAEDFSEYDYAAGRVGLEVSIEKRVSPSYHCNFAGQQPYFDRQGMTMFPMVHFEELFEGNVSYEINDNTVTITKNVLGVLTVVSVTADSYILLRDGKEIKMNTVPVQQDGTIYIPLEFVGDALSYNILWNDYRKMIEFFQYNSVYVYVWNENKNSSLDGIRYSYIISGDYTLDMSAIKENTTSDFNEVRELLEKLPSKAWVYTTTLYKIKGYTVPYRIISEIMEVGRDGRVRRLSHSYTRRCLDEIPSIIKNLDDSFNKWYSQELFALDEDSLNVSKGHVYRLSYFPSFTDPFVVRIEIKKDGTADVFYKVGDGIAAYGYSNGIKKLEKLKLGKKETQQFLELLDKTDYWRLPDEIDRLGCDGHFIVIEGVKDKIYHIVNRWVPEKTDPVSIIVEYFFNLVGQELPE